MSSRKKEKNRHSWMSLFIVILSVLIAALLAALIWFNRDQLLFGADPSGQTAQSGSSSYPSYNSAQDPLTQAGLECNGYSLFSGQYVEDGSDEEVKDVASILITNRSGKFLDMATLTYEIDGETAVFIVTGLPNGRSAWVMEAERKTAKADAKFTCVEVVPGYRDDAVSAVEGLDISAGVGLMTVSNNTGKTMKDVFILYKNIHSDNNYFGGITYKVTLGDLEPGQTVEKLSSHFSPDSEIVRIVQNLELAE